MYLLGQETTIEWEILATDNPPALGDLDLIIMSSQGGKIYQDAPALAEEYTPPTSMVNGKLTQKFTPNCEGLWKIQLVIGTATNYQVLSKVEMYVFDSTTVTHLSSRKAISVVTTDATEFTVDACHNNGILYVCTSDSPVYVTLAGSGSEEGYGEIVYFMQSGMGEVILQGAAGVSLSSSDGNSTRTVNSVIAAIYLNILRWVIVGDTGYYLSEQTAPL